ncbi:MAG: hypothetical protein LBI82_00970 [Dysgonamonadaceae bacterium]|jgi:hypothetical protein|nr:hypothetical protein [Dysgonamonadaceae bacterium]
MEQKNEIILYQEIPLGRTKEEILQREKIIKNFYVAWNIANPGKRIYNVSLQAFIHIKFLSFQETVEKASRSYKSTLAVTYLTEILELATVVNYTKPKEGNKKQSRFYDIIIIMQYSKANFGIIKLTVGILRGSREKIQYCITTIEKTTAQPATYTQ